MYVSVKEGDSSWMTLWDIALPLSVGDSLLEVGIESLRVVIPALAFLGCVFWFDSLGFEWMVQSGDSGGWEIEERRVRSWGWRCQLEP